jgi:two-component system chemotaxis response regulator CheB
VTEAAQRLERPARELVVIGASAGGVEALATIAAGLPADFPAAVLVALHLPEGGTSVLPTILDRAGRLPARAARDDEPVRPGTIAVAPPGHHLVVADGRTRLLRGPKVNGYRPSVDVLFHSAARSYGRGVIGVVLTGALSDGAFGLRAIKRRGGAAVVQADAAHTGMPESALASVDADAVTPLRSIPAALTMFVETEEATMRDEGSPEESELEAGFDPGQLQEAPGSPSVFRCPECGGALCLIEDAGLSGFA